MCCTGGGPAAAVHGALWAVDLRTGKVVSKATFPIANESGMLSTGGDLLFTGSPRPARFAAYDADTLQEIWSFNLGTPITAPAMSYSVNGKQYIAIIAGGEAGPARRPRSSQPSAVVAVFGSDMLLLPRRGKAFTLASRHAADPAHDVDRAPHQRHRGFQRAEGGVRGERHVLHARERMDRARAARRGRRRARRVPICPLRSASISGASSTSAPRAVLIRITPRFMRRCAPHR